MLTPFLQQQDEEVYSSLLQLLEPSAEAQLAELDASASKVLIKLCNKYACRLITSNQSNDAVTLFDLAQQLLMKPELKLDPEAQILKRTIWNNLSLCCHDMKNKDLFVKFLKRILNHEKKSPDYTHAMAYNNLAALYLSSGFYDKALKYTTEALNLIELEVFSAISEIQKYKFEEKPRRNFVPKLKIMLVGYLNMGICIEKMRANSSRFPDSNFDETLDEKQFYVNGYELSVKYLGGESEFTKKFDYCLGRNRKNNSVSTPKEFKISRNRNLAALASEFLREDERKRKSNNVSSTSREIKATDQTNNHGNPLSTSAVEIKSEISNGKHSSRTSRSSRSIGKSSIRKGLNFILKKQQQFEEKMSKKLEETIQSSQMIEKQIQELKQKELEIQLEMLKRSQEEMRKRNLELEYELRTAKNNTVFESSSPTNPMYYFPREQSGRASQTKYVPNISPSTRKAQSHRESTGTNTNQIQKAGEAGSTYVFDAPQGVESKDYQRTVQSKKSSLKFPQNGEDLSEILMDNSELMNQIDEEDLDGQGLTSDNQDPYLRAKSRSSSVIKYAAELK